MFHEPQEPKMLEGENLEKARREGKTLYKSEGAGFAARVRVYDAGGGVRYDVEINDISADAFRTIDSFNEPAQDGRPPFAEIAAMDVEEIEAYMYGSDTDDGRGSRALLNAHLRMLAFNDLLKSPHGTAVRQSDVDLMGAALAAGRDALESSAISETGSAGELSELIRAHAGFKVNDALQTIETRMTWYRFVALEAQRLAREYAGGHGALLAAIRIEEDMRKAAETEEGDKDETEDAAQGQA